MSNSMRQWVAAALVALSSVGCGGGDGDSSEAVTGGTEGQVSPTSPESAPAGGGNDGDFGQASPSSLESEPAGADLPKLEDPYAEVEMLLEDAGLDICSRDQGSGDISGSYDSISYSLGNAESPCSGDPLDWPGSLSVDLYNDPTTASLELVQPTTDAYILWLVDPVSLVSTVESSTLEVLSTLKEAFADYPTGGRGA